MKFFSLILSVFITTFCNGNSIRVTRIIDGDTFEIETGESVRLIGINAPEISDIFGKEAKEHLQFLVENKMVELISDNISKDRDVYGRLLRYVYFNKEDINKKMIIDGFAFAYLKYPFTKKLEYSQAQLDAKNNNSGIWNNDQNIKVLDEQKKEEEGVWQRISLKTYLVVALVSILLILGFHYYYKK